MVKIYEIVNGLWNIINPKASTRDVLLKLDEYNQLNMDQETHNIITLARFIFDYRNNPKQKSAQDIFRRELAPMYGLAPAYEIATKVIDELYDCFFEETKTMYGIKKIGGYSAQYCRKKWNEEDLTSEVDVDMFWKLFHLDVKIGANSTKLFNGVCAYGAFHLLLTTAQQSLIILHPNNQEDQQQSLVLYLCYMISH